jgi:divalent metal cation (Fe/Co/Zn/Cd) transporter
MKLGSLAVALFFWIVGILISLRGLLTILGVMPPHSDYPVGEIGVGLFPIGMGILAWVVFLDERRAKP